MKYVLTNEMMRKADETTIRLFGMPELVLMERAALSLDEVTEHYLSARDKTENVLILAGPGNNGADGVALARLLLQHGYIVTLLLCSGIPKENSSLDIQLRILKAFLHQGKGNGDCRILEGDSSEEVIDTFLHPFSGDDWNGFRSPGVIVDALFGTGLSREVVGCYERLLLWANDTDAYRIAADIPTGICGNSGRVLGCAFKAHETVTFGFLKQGHILYPGRSFSGKVSVADIGIPINVLPEGERQSLGFTYEPEDLNELFPKRNGDSHKGSFGKVLLIAGTDETAPGAAVLCGKAIFAAGAGMLRIVTHEENKQTLICALPEAMTADRNCDTETIEKYVSWADAVAAGPGLGTGKEAKDLLSDLLVLTAEKQKKLVLDADALNLIASDSELSERMIMSAKRTTVVLTPHPGELCRLLHTSAEKLESNRIELIQSYCKATGIIMAAKDADTIVCDGNRLYFNKAGNGGMATAGSGDVLTGVIVAIMAGDKQMTDPLKAVSKAVFLHAISGDSAALCEGEYSMTAGSIVRAIKLLLG